MFAEIDIKNKTVKRVFNGKGRRNCLPVIDNSVYPTGPDMFKAQPTYSYIIYVGTWLDEVEDKAGWEFLPTDHVEQIAVQEMLPLEQCKAKVYELLAAKRWDMETAGLVLGDVILPTDRETSIIIQSFPDAAITAFKIKDGVFVKNKTAEEIAVIKLAHRNFIQDAFNWESDETDKVSDMDYDELVVYVESLA